MRSIRARGSLRIGAFLVTAISALTMTLGGGAANAAVTEPAHAFSIDTPFCATRALTLDESTANRSAHADTTCFASQGEAVAAATGVEEYKNLTNEEAFALVLEGGQLNSVTARSGPVPLSTALLSVDSADWHYQGATNYWYGQTTGCDSTSYVANSMPTGWDDIVSSSLLVASGGCAYNWHYEHPSRGGAAINCDYSNRCYYIGDAMNDRTSSETWG